MFGFWKKKQKTKKDMKKKRKIKGYIAYYGIEEFWLNMLSEEQREEVKVRYSKGMNTDIKSIDEHEVTKAYMPIQMFLGIMAEGISDYKIKDYLIDWAIKEVEKAVDIEEKHFTYMSSWRQYKLMIRDDKSFYPEYILLLKKDCSFHEEFNKAYLKKYEDLPNYPAFKELALAYERTKEIQKAIDISKLAIKLNVKEQTSFENRIAKLEKKL